MKTPKFFSLMILLILSSLLVFQVLEARMLFPYLPPSNGNGFGGNDNQEDIGRITRSPSDLAGVNGYVNTTVYQRDVDKGGKLVTEQANGHRVEVVTKTHTASFDGINYDDNNGGQRLVNTGSGSQTAKNSLQGVQDVENNSDGAQHANNDGSGVQQVINNGDGVQNANNEGNGVQQMVNNPTGSANSNVDRNGGVKRVVDEGGQPVTQQVNGDGVQVVTKDGDGQTHTTSVGLNGINYDGNH